MSFRTPVIAIVGRPNVGKSTLFNRIVGYRKAIVDGTPGVTRDRNYGLVSIHDRSVYLIDTGGFETVSNDKLKEQVLEQTMLAIEEADLVLLVCDGQQGKNPADEEIAKILRVSGKACALAINKIDEPVHDDLLSDFYSLGFNEMLPLSAEHKIGVDHLLERISALLPTEEMPGSVSEEGLIRVSVIGKPNSGKSSLINNILGGERIIVNGKAGTTRDSIDTLVRVNGKEYFFVDTAGIRKKTRVSQKLEKYSVLMALKSIERSDVVILLIDALKGIGMQDVKIGAHAEEFGRACIIAVNKWDLMEKKTNTLKDFELKIREKFSFLPYAPILSISALTGKRVEKLFPMIEKSYQSYCHRLHTSEVTRLFEEAFRKKPPPLYRRKTIRMFFTSQTDVRPPTFVCFVNQPEGISPSYRRYLGNQIRKKYDFEGSPVRIFFKSRN